MSGGGKSQGRTWSEGWYPLVSEGITEPLGIPQAVYCDVSSERGHCQEKAISTLIYPASASPFSSASPQC